MEPGASRILRGVGERDGLEERVARIEGVLEQMSDRLHHLGTRINALDSKLDSHFGWTLSFIVGMWVTVIAAVLFTCD